MYSSVVACKQQHMYTVVAQAAEQIAGGTDDNNHCLRADSPTGHILCRERQQVRFSGQGEEEEDRTNRHPSTKCAKVQALDLQTIASNRFLETLRRFETMQHRIEAFESLE